MLKIETTPHVKGILENARKAAIRLNHKNVGEDLLFHVFMTNVSLTCSNALEKCGISAKDLWQESGKYIDVKKGVGSDGFTKKSRGIIELAQQLSVNQFGEDYLSPEVFFLSFFCEEHLPKAIKSFFNIKTSEDIMNDPVVRQVFERIALIVKDKEEFFEPQTQETEENDEPADWIPMFEENPILSKFAENLNIAAANGEFDNFVDFDNKVDEMATILCRKKKPNVILVGVAGGGKTSLVAALANKIVKGDAPDLLSNKVIYSVNLSSMVAGTQYRGQFEKRLEDFICEAKKYSNLILFIDEIHTLVGAGGGSATSLEASNILKPELAKGTISCIGATTINEYTQTIKRDSALDRRFERVIVRQPSRFKMQEILPDILGYYEEFHGVKYTPEFTENVVDFCERFLPNRSYPDKAIDVIDHCGAQAKVKFWEMDDEVKNLQSSLMKKVEESGEVSNKDVESLNNKIEAWEEKLLESHAEVNLSHLRAFFETKGSPLNNISIVDSVAEEIKSTFVGNKKELSSLFKKIRVSTLGINKKNSSAPDVFLVSGADSTGKTLFCSVLKDSLERMGANVLSYSGVEFSDSYAPYKIVSPNHNNTSLAEKILIHPNSIIIIDDFENVHYSCDGLFSQILKEGKIQMSNGDTADFSNCKIFLTSGVTSGSSMGFHKEDFSTSSNINPKILNLIEHKVALFAPNKRDLRRILYNKLQSIKLAAKISGSNFIFDFKFLKRFVDENYSSENSMKKLNEAIEKKLIPDISEKLLSGVLEINV